MKGQNSMKFSFTTIIKYSYITSKDIQKSTCITHKQVNDDHTQALNQAENYAMYNTYDHFNKYHPITSLTKITLLMSKKLPGASNILDCYIKEIELHKPTMIDNQGLTLTY